MKTLSLAIYQSLLAAVSFEETGAEGSKMREANS